MGKPSLAPPSYRDDPEALSLHTTPDDYDYEDTPDTQGLLPPSYNDSQGESSGSVSGSLPGAYVPIRHTVPATKRIDHQQDVSIKNGVPQVCESTGVMDVRCDTDPAYLEEYVRSFAAQPPQPLVYILGTHSETTKRGDKKETKTVTDFRIVMHLQHYLRQNFDPNAPSMIQLSTVENSEKTYRGTITKQRAPGSTQDIEVSGASKPSLKEWCHRYCASPRTLRIFTLRRPVTGLDRELIRSRIEGLIRATSYRGHISVTFPVEEKNIDIYTTSRINEWRLKTWVRWVFYLSFLWIFAWPSLFFATKRYAVVRAEWPFSINECGGAKRYTTISENQWFEKWEVAIRRLVLSQFEGEATDDVLAGVIARPEDPSIPGTFNSGLQGLDQAAGLLSQGFRFARAMQSGERLGATLQGGWGYNT
ncbi:hypothetical protein P280DRAFT_177811 [Massarina eburnea CBS 473.64]|uniref:Uncharacterized protein n=1 Tax=Massarina eburnea CBS 473.64 TaxID=1395130 RepID=A0A6A6SEN5_9PLEO|nr:hypothetical protein P280DRAFT_177811 [Massarina eburnea CBS 473.64]